VVYFFPVSELLAVTVTPGSGMFPDFTVPEISPYGAADAGWAAEAAGDVWG
jgi:hypothetical protein